MVDAEWAKAEVMYPPPFFTVDIQVPQDNLTLLGYIQLKDAQATGAGRLLYKPVDCDLVIPIQTDIEGRTLLRYNDIHTARAKMAHYNSAQLETSGKQDARRYLDQLLPPRVDAGIEITPTTKDILGDNHHLIQVWQASMTGVSHSRLGAMLATPTRELTRVAANYAEFINGTIPKVKISARLSAPR